jgi:peptidoglycan/xylan/chitin deacetylase (PgdA/CDA1 family)
MLKAWLRYGLAENLRISGLLACMERPARAGLTVLCYHRVLPDVDKDRYFLSDLAVTPAAMQAHARLLQERYTVLPLREAYAAWRDGTAYDKPLASVTFDDGYRDNFVHAKPALEAAGVRGTFFIVTGLIDSSTAPWYDRMGRACARLYEQGQLAEAVDCVAETGCGPLHTGWLSRLDEILFPIEVVEFAKSITQESRLALLDRLLERAGGDDLDPALDRIMSREQLIALEAAGHEVASHSRTHPILPQLDAEALEAELSGSRDDLTTILGKTPRTFCYPNGDHNDAVVEAARHAGYEAAVTTRQGINLPGTAPFTLARVFVHEERLTRPGGYFSASLFRLEMTPLKHRLRG